jgi:hypothetical protein
VCTNSIVSVWLSVTALATAQSQPTPAQLVEQLASVDQRARAREQLLALGKQAVPALCDRVSAEPRLQAEVLTILIELGPDAGAAVPPLVAAMRGSPDDPTSTLRALAELAPFRAPDVEIDKEELSRFQLRGLHRRGRPDTDPDPSLESRLQQRLAFPRAPDLASLLTIVQGYQAFRVELAVEHLGLLGPAAAVALPMLQRLLERPEPRILTTELTVSLHRKAARAVLAIAPTSPAAELARAVLAGKSTPRSAAPPVPERARARIAELVAQLDDPTKRSAAAANLVALGALAAPAIAATLADEHDTDSREAALGILRDLGPRAASAVPELAEALASLSAEHTVSVLRALQATAPWCRDVVTLGCTACSIGQLELLGHRIRGRVDAEFLTAFFAAQMDFTLVMAVDPSCSLAELGIMLDSPAVTTREAALAVARERGAGCRPLLPTLAGMLTADPPKGHFVRWTDAGGIETGPLDRTAVVQRLAAQAIVAIAPPDDPLLVAAREVLARPEPK